MNKKKRIKAGLIFGITMTLFFILENLLALDNLTAKKLILRSISALIGGSLAGFLFGWLIGVLDISKFLTRWTKISLINNETILFETGANHFKGVEAVGGKLYLTNKRLVFKSHKFNIQNHELSISLSDIDGVDRYKTLGLVDKGLFVKTVNAKTEKFVVQKIDEWINQLAGIAGL